jgi:hypothetical protein
VLCGVCCCGLVQIGLFRVLLWRGSMPGRAVASVTLHVHFVVAGGSSGGGSSAVTKP